MQLIAFFPAETTLKMHSGETEPSVSRVQTDHHVHDTEKSTTKDTISKLNKKP